MKAQQLVQCMVPRALFGGVRNTSKSVYLSDSQLLLSRPSVSGAYLRSTQENNYSGIKYTVSSVCVFSSHSFWTSSSLDVAAGVTQEEGHTGGRSHRRKVTQEEGHTGFLIHLLSAVRALIFLARRIQPFLSLVDCEVEFRVLIRPTLMLYEKLYENGPNPFFSGFFNLMGTRMVQIRMAKSVSAFRNRTTNGFGAQIRLLQ